MDKIINLAMLKNPLNWLTVFLMLLIFGIFADLIAGHYINVSNAAAANS